MALAKPNFAPLPEPFIVAPRVKRCTFRRVTAVDGRRGRIYDVECQFPDRSVPMPLGDLEGAMLICNACAAPGTFRADED